MASKFGGIPVESQPVKQSRFGGVAVDNSVRDAALAEVAAEQGPMDSLAIAMGKGFYNIGRGLGIADPESDIEKAAYAQLSYQRPYTTTAGEIIGESAPFIIPGAGAGKIASVVPRAIAMAGLGAAEGSIGARGRGEDLNSQVVHGAVAGTVAGGLELAMPSIVRAGSKVFRRVMGREPTGSLIDAAGRPTAELQDALAKAGTNYDDLAQAAMQDLAQARPGTNPEQAARAALFASESVPATRGAITKDFGQQAAEARLAESVADPAASPFRGAILTQSEAIKSRLDDLVNNLGVPERTGEAIKEALSSQKAMLRSQKSALYKQAAEQADNLGVMPLVPDSLASSLPDAATLRRINRLSPGPAGAVDDLMQEFGIKQASEGFDGVVTPIGLNNFEDFRAALNQIERSDPSDAVKVITGPLKRALDAETDIMSDALEASGNAAAKDLVGKLKEARGVVREIKTDFSPQSIAGRLIDVKRDGVTPILEASQVAPKLFSKATPVEHLQKTMASLAKSGDKGKQAIGDLQATAVMRLMDEAFGASSRQIDGVATFSPGAFQKAIKNIGEDKLNLLFSNNAQALTRIKNLESISKAIQAPSGAVPKGSASVILDVMQRVGMSKVPFGGAFMEAVSSLQSSGATRREVVKALSAKPEMSALATSISRDYPAMATVLGIAGFGQAESEEPPPLVITRGR